MLLGHHNNTFFCWAKEFSECPLVGKTSYVGICVSSLFLLKYFIANLV
jgi:hypothetical protein